MTSLSNHEYKRYHILNLINRYGSISRTKLADITDYRLATIGHLIKEMLDESLIVERGSVNVGQGRSRTLLEINYAYLAAVGVVIYPPEINIIFCSPRGDIWENVSIPFDGSWAAEQIIASVITNINAMRERHREMRIIGIGICDPGVVAANREYSVSSVYIEGWKNIHLRAVVEEGTKLPVTVSSRVYLTALAEQNFGLAQGQKDFICLILSKGIGLSFACNGHVVNGHTAMAGQIGHTYMANIDRPCYCGNLGCMESVCSLPAIHAQIASALTLGCNSVLYPYRTHTDDISVEDIRAAIDAGDRLCINVVKNAARVIGLSLANTINILNPQSVIMSGEMVAFGDVFLDTIAETAREHVIPIFNSNIEYCVSKLIGSNLQLGAASLVFSGFLHSEQFSDLYSTTIEETVM